MSLIVVPGSLSNLGPGFDVLGVAVSLLNRFDIRDQGEGEPTDDDHLVVATIRAAAERFAVPAPARWWVRQQEEVPRSRGLGSSATARIAGLLAWMRATGTELSDDDALAFLSEGEGHPDNVIAAWLGGAVIAALDGDRVVVRSVPVAASIRVALCIPTVEVRTDAARSVLPAQLSRADAVFNASRLAMLLHGLRTGDAEALALGVEDRLHHAYRAPLIGPVDAAIAAARRAGAAAGFISGSGSTLGALVLDGDANAVAEALASPFDNARALVVSPTLAGARERSGL